MSSMNGIVEAIEVTVGRHSERLRDHEEDLSSMRQQISFDRTATDQRNDKQDQAISRIEKKLDRLMVQKTLVVALVLLVGGGLLGGIPWLMQAQLRNMLLEMNVVEMKVAK